MAQSHVPQAMRRQVKEANRMVAALSAGQDPFQGKAPPSASPPPSNPSPGPSIQPVPEFVVVGDAIPAGFKPVDLTRGDPRAQPPEAAPPDAAAPPQPTNPSSRWVPASQGNQPAQPPQARPAAAPPAPSQTPPPGAEPADPRYRVLQGKYNTEVRELRGQVNDLMAMNRQLLTAMQARPAAAPLTPPPVPKTARERALAAGFSEKEIEEYGEDVISMMVRTAENIAGPQVAQLRQENARLASTVQNTVQTVSRSAADRFWDDLADLVPEWAEINASQEWLDWLQQPDIFSGRTRNDGLQSAFAEHNARRVAGIFDAFKAEDARARSTAGGGQHLDPATLIAPGQTAAGTPAPAGNDPAATRIWSEEEVRQFYSAVRRGRIKGDEKARVEAEINEALRTGRIKPDHNDAFLINSR